jgi:hypothetical protein
MICDLLTTELLVRNCLGEAKKLQPWGFYTHHTIDPSLVDSLVKGEQVDEVGTERVLR